MLAQNRNQIVSCPTSGRCCLWFLRAVRAHPHPVPSPRACTPALPTPPLLSLLQAPGKAELTPASGPLLFSPPEVLFSASCSTARASLTGTFLTSFSQTAVTSPTALPVVTHPPAWHCLFVYWCHDTMSLVKMVPCLNIIKKCSTTIERKDGKSSANERKLQRPFSSV